VACGEQRRTVSKEDAVAKFTVLGDIDPFLHVSLNQGERVYAESDAMVMMETNLEMQGRMTGGLLNSLARRLANGESFFQQEVVASRGSGDCLFSPVLPGSIELLDVGQRRYTITDGAFVAAETSVELKVKMQGLGNALLAQTGGFLVMEASGQGKLAVSGFGSIFTIDVEPGKDVIIDNAHVVAWDSTLTYNISATSLRSGIVRSLVSSVTTGEGLVLKFSGAGKVVLCSRNRDSYVTWLGKRVRGTGNDRLS
jgi:uncharacterized protein (TIGR00266 family)